MYESIYTAFYLLIRSRLQLQVGIGGAHYSCNHAARRYCMDIMISVYSKRVSFQKLQRP